MKKKKRSAMHPRSTTKTYKKKKKKEKTPKDINKAPNCNFLKVIISINLEGQLSKRYKQKNLKRIDLLL